MQLLLPILYALLFILLIVRARFFRLKGISKIKLVALFLFKIAIGIIAWLIYTHHYSFADFQTYFADGKLLVRQLLEPSAVHTPMRNWDSEFDPILYNNSRTMIVLNALLLLFSFGNFFVHIVFFCFFSFTGLVSFYKAFINFYPGKNIQLIIAIFLVPSVLFWTSLVSKECIAIAITGLIVYLSNFGLESRYNIKRFTTLIILLALLVLIKIYIAFVLIPLLLANLLITKTSVKYALLKYAFVFLSFGVLAIAAKLIHPDYDFLKLISDKRTKAISEARGGVFLVNDKNFICINYADRDRALVQQPGTKFRIREGASYLSWKLDNMQDTTFVTHAHDTASYRIFYIQPPANTVLELKKIKPEILDFVQASPQAIANVLLQPTIFNVKSWLHLMAAVENLWLLVLLLLAIVFFDRSLLNEKKILWFSLFFVLLLFLLVGITTPVVGSIVRYRTPGLLFLVPLLLLSIDWKKINSLLKKQRENN